MNENTTLLHGYSVIDPHTGAASIPKYQTSTFNQTNLLDKQEYSYTRFGNPTVDALEEGIAVLEGASYGFAFSSGMAAISTVLMLLKTGDHVIVPIEVYGGTCQFVKEILPNYGIEASFVDYSDETALKAAVTPRTKMIYVETPSNPLLKVTDISHVVKIAQDRSIMTVMDNTFMTPLYQKPLELGVDIVIESATKFLNGHSDVLAGLVATNNEDVAQRLRLFQKAFGCILGVEDAWLVLRGMKTMGIRMDRSVSNAEKIAHYLENHPKVCRVYYPGLSSHLNHDCHMRQAKNGGAVLSVDLGSEHAVEQFANHVTLPIIAVSLGGVESILSYPRTMSHACLSEEERQEQGVTEGLVRLSCGIEDIEDILTDLEIGLSYIS